MKPFEKTRDEFLQKGRCSYSGLRLFRPSSFCSRSKELFRSLVGEKSDCIKQFFVRSEITSYSWNEMSMEQNDRTPLFDVRCKYLSGQVF